MKCEGNSAPVVLDIMLAPIDPNETGFRTVDA